MKAKSNKTVKSCAWDLLINISLGGFTLACIIPVILVVIISITEAKYITIHGYSFFPKGLSLEAYRVVLTDTQSILRVYGVSIFVTVFGTLLSVIITAMLAYPLSRSSFRYRNIISFIIFFTMLFNGGMVPWYIICTQVLHLRNTLWALIVPYLVSAFNVIIMKTFFKTTIHESLIESAKLDGAGDFKILRSIVLPLSLPVLATVGLFTSISYWNDWWLPTILIDDNRWINLQYAMTRVIRNAAFLAEIGLSSGASSTHTELARMPTETVRMAMCVLAMGPIVLAYPFLQKYFVKGLTIGSIKG